MPDAKLLITMLDAVYIDARQSRSIVAVKPKPPFRPVFQMAVSRKESGIRVVKEPLNSSPSGSSVFLVETGEGGALAGTRVTGFVGWQKRSPELGESSS